jgi:hypothetical protein
MEYIHTTIKLYALKQIIQMDTTDYKVPQERGSARRPTNDI